MKAPNDPAMSAKPLVSFDLLGITVQLSISWVFLCLLVIGSLAKGYFPASYLGMAPSTYWWMGAAGALGLFGSLLFHELAHSFAAKRYGIQIKHITLFIFGGVAQLEKEPPSPKAEFFMALAGPLASFALSAACYLALKAGYAANLPLAVLGLLGYLAFVNSLVGGFNLIPAFPLDGGRALRAGLWHWKKDLRRATRPVCLAGVIVGFVLMMAGIFHVITGDFLVGAWWFILGLFLREAARTSYYELVSREKLAGRVIHHFMTANPETVSSVLSIEQLVEEHVYRSLHDIYPVLEDSRLIGYVGSKQIANIPRDEWSTLTVHDVTVPCSAENTVDINSAAPDVLSLMNSTGNSRLLVTDGGNLAGIITLRDLMKFLTLKLNFEERVL
ncbi:MAG: site-2 protease family protein [Nitrospira sp.]|nr:site-2 protease family protein [Nitrospira sp.]